MNKYAKRMKNKTSWNKKDWKKHIVNLITENQGCKMIEIISDRRIAAMDKYNPEGLIDELVKEGEIIEIEYALPEIPYRTKSFLLPAGTEVKVFSTADIYVGD